MLGGVSKPPGRIADGLWPPLVSSFRLDSFNISFRVHMTYRGTTDAHLFHLSEYTTRINYSSSRKFSYCRCCVVFYANCFEVYELFPGTYQFYVVVSRITASYRFVVVSNRECEKGLPLAMAEAPRLENSPSTSNQRFVTCFCRTLLLLPENTCELTANPALHTFPRANQ